MSAAVYEVTYLDGSVEEVRGVMETHEGVLVLTEYDDVGTTSTIKDVTCIPLSSIRRWRLVRR